MKRIIVALMFLTCICHADSIMNRFPIFSSVNLSAAGGTIVSNPIPIMPECNFGIKLQASNSGGAVNIRVYYVTNDTNAYASASTPDRALDIWGNIGTPFQNEITNTAWHQEAFSPVTMLWLWIIVDDLGGTAADTVITATVVAQ